VPLRAPIKREFYSRAHYSSSQVDIICKIFANAARDEWSQLYKALYRSSCSTPLALYCGAPRVDIESWSLYQQPAGTTITTMPSKNLPLFTRSDVESHKSEKSCYVTLGENVYDLTDFIESHPGGGNLILDYAGKDVADILKDEISHTHSETAYEILDDSLVGFLVSDKPINGAAAIHGAAKTTALENGNGEADGDGPKPHPRTGMSSAEDLSKETDYDKDYKTHKFLDLNRPLFPQIWYGGYSKKFYLEQVHRPRHYKGGQSAPLFGNFLEPLTKTPWWIIPTLYWPIIAYGTWYASRGFENHLLQAGLWVFGFYFWTIIEYVMHRFLFHLDE
jgi:4-hydroxysphinganine ceramide fatty acyl 2-hydroxylase